MCSQSTIKTLTLAPLQIKSNTVIQWVFFQVTGNLFGIRVTFIASLALNGLRRESFDPFHTAGFFPYPLKTSENQMISDVFRGYKKTSGMKWAKGKGTTKNFAMVFAAAYILVNLKQSYLEKKLSKLAYLKLKLSLVWLTVRILVKNFRGIFGGGRV